jgi:hypothetical protein
MNYVNITSRREDKEMPEVNLPAELEERIRYYENPANDPGGFKRKDWVVVLGTGVLLPIVALLIGWNVGWSA